MCYAIHMKNTIVIKKENIFNARRNLYFYSNRKWVKI